MKIYFTIMMLFLSLNLAAQSQSSENAGSTDEKIEMADRFRAEGKIYVVLVVIFIILAGLFAYMIVTDKKLSRLERQIHRQKQDGMKLN